MEGRLGKNSELIFVGQENSVPIVEILGARYIDRSGIPLDSNRNPLLVEGIDFKLQPNPFIDSPSRYPDGHSHLAPMSGLERQRLKENYQYMVGALRFVRDAYVASIRPEESRREPLNTQEAINILIGLTFLPHYLAFRTKKAVNVSGKLPESIIVLSNAASGSTGALFAYEELHSRDQDFPTQVPDPEEMLSEIEKRGSMVGKTVCVASPQQIKHFLRAVVDGAIQNYQNDLEGILNAEEIPQLIAFGRAMYHGRETMHLLKKLDVLTSKEMQRHIKKKRDKKVKALAANYLNEGGRLMTGLTVDQIQVDEALGRNTIEKGIRLEDLNEALKLKTPDLISILNPNQKPAPAGQRITIVRL